ncbi:response regulator transcription factor [Halomonas caseinilytica]|uniref:Two component transcriptional regulator, LuxR family n=1 Tax=Halomonas caseinilytica TaxID=438744 RepID=A0A1M6SJY2_9GAMM|nr:response regulator transcription factor [Halomonas caseinilytica]SHK44956.1 two component transcriptional regulator, LuxR family [Halomonas caseinilytica]
MKKIRIIIADDHPLVLLGLKEVINRYGEDKVEVVGEANDPDELWRCLNEKACDVVVTDFNMPSGKMTDGLELISRIRRNFPSVTILVVTMVYNSSMINAIFKSGANGVFDKREELPVLVGAIRSINNKSMTLYSSRWVDKSDSHMTQADLERKLSKRELEVIRLYASGLSGREIAKKLNKSEKTISRQKRSAMEKLGVESDVYLNQTISAIGLI